MRNHAPFVSATLVLAVGTAAQAGEVSLGESGHVAVSAERLFGFVHSEITQNRGGVQTANFANTLNVLGAPFGGAATSYAWPRIGFDLFLNRGLSLGASLSYAHASTSPMTGSTDAFQIAPRVGVAVMFGPRFGIWPRLGFTFDYISSGPVTQSLFALSADATFVLVVAPGIALTAAPITDIPLGGSEKNETTGTSIDTKLADIGIEAGLVLYF